MKKTIFPLLATLAVLATGCQEQKTAPADSRAPAPSETTSGNQFQLCETHSWQQAINDCKEGQLVSVLPNRWGNEQLPLTLASVVCNFDHNVAFNNGGVVCIFTRKRYDNLLAEAAKKPAAAPSQEKK